MSVNEELNLAFSKLSQIPDIKNTVSVFYDIKIGVNMKFQK